MSGCGMLQGQGQNAMQFKCVQISLDNSLSFSWVTAVSTTWKNWLRKYSSGVVQACAGAGPQSRLGGRLCRGNSGNGTSLSRHNITASINRAWNMSSSRRHISTVIFIAVTMEATDLLLNWTARLRFSNWSETATAHFRLTRKLSWPITLAKPWAFAADSAGAESAYSCSASKMQSKLRRMHLSAGPLYNMQITFAMPHLDRCIA